MSTAATVLNGKALLGFDYDDGSYAFYGEAGAHSLKICTYRPDFTSLDFSGAPVLSQLGNIVTAQATGVVSMTNKRPAEGIATLRYDQGRKAVSLTVTVKQGDQYVTVWDLPFTAFGAEDINAFKVAIAPAQATSAPTV